MSLNFIATEHAPAAVGPYSQAVQAGSMVFVSGQLGLVPGSGQFAGEDFEAQAVQALKNVKAILDASGCRISDIASVDVFMVDLSHFKIFNALYDEFMNGHRPARAAVQVAALPLGGLVEVKCIAVKAN